MQLDLGPSRILARKSRRVYFSPLAVKEVQIFRRHEKSQFCLIFDQTDNIHQVLLDESDDYCIFDSNFAPCPKKYNNLFAIPNTFFVKKVLMI